MNSAYFSICIFLFQFLYFSNISAQTTIKALFLGNSYTAYNNLPQLVHNIALSTGDTLIFDSNTPGGMLLRFHSWDVVSQNKLVANNWDYVVLQGQSQESITGNSNFNSGGRTLNSQIRNILPCATPMLYMTWGRENGDASNCLSYPVMCTYEGMDSTIRNNYLALAALIKVEVSPVSVVWKYLRQNHSNIQLYSSDGSHPSSAGSYAAACCFYATIFKKDPSLVSYDFNLSPTDAAVIRNAVKLEVFNKLNMWDYKQAPSSEFSFKVDSGLNTVSFFAHDSVDTYLWDFGDGTSSSLASPTHSYNSNGTYNVQLTTTNCNQQTYLTSTSDTIIQFCNHTPTVGPINPWLCILDTLWTQNADSYQWLYQGEAIPETNQFLHNYQQYGTGIFSVITTINGCAELSQEYIAWPLYAGYTFYQHPHFANPCLGDTAYLFLRNYVAPITGLEFIQWYKDSLPISNSDTLMITEGGFYEMKVIEPNSNCLQDTSYSYINIECANLHIQPLSRQEKLWYVYPSPTTNNLWIELDKVNNTILEQVQLYNSFGVLLKELKINASAQQIDVSGLPSGIYFIRPKNPQYATLKFVKQ